ncbi:uncharacterized protein EV420DRAFT_1474435 [Desarmillaria tabescens]|uniref:Uncharacterized protein n=1 Tax=Armillaria tabescens TaxID=1929756 RepID=A0AA39TQK0_ARMTA|nr:uncharacterized protein EV420DRAFT_1474435 [Desarmillaria tabescens]KAK0467037.1 hypothetical protein EV420DRAFT_1474435 [Desarmillaria tabescens]
MPSSFDNEENIHPDLRQSSVDMYLEESRRRFQAQLSQIHQDSQNSSVEAPDRIQNLEGSNDPMIATSIVISAPNMTATARRLKRKMEFSDEAEVDFDEFSTLSADKCQLYLMAVTLQTRDLLQKMQTSQESWEISKGLWKNISQYVKAFLLSSTAVCYVGNSSYHVMVALREMNIKDLPSENDMTANALLQSRISACLTTKRSQIKDAVKVSIQDSKDGRALRNIACLTKHLIGKSNEKIPQTQQLYMRLSVVRHVYANIETARGDTFWAEVDRMLHGMRAHGQELFIYTLNEIYIKDKKEYGDPTKSGIRSVELASFHLPKWVKKINELTPKVQLSQGDGERPGKRQRTGDQNEGSDDDDDVENVTPGNASDVVATE